MILNITDIIRIHALGNAGCLPICPLFQVHDAMELQSNLCHFGCPAMVNASIRAASRRKLAHRSLRSNALRQHGFGMLSAIVVIETFRSGILTVCPEPKASRFYA